MVVCCSTEDQSVSSLLTCVICQEYYDVDLRLPKLLDCHHTLCLPCLEGYKSQGREIITCPYKCKRRTSLKRPDYAGNVNRLATNMYILPFVEKMTKLRKIDEDAKQHEGTTVQEMETVDSPEPIEPSEELSHQTPALLFYDSPHLPMRRQGIVYIQFSVNGVVRPAIGIKLCRRSAPNMCNVFLNYVLGRDHNLTYQNTKISAIKRGEVITFGQFSNLNKLVANDIEVHEREEHLYFADYSSLRPLRGAVWMRHRGRCDLGRVLIGSEFSINLVEQVSLDSFTTVIAYVDEGLYTVCDEISQLDPSRNRIMLHSCEYTAEE